MNLILGFLYGLDRELLERRYFGCYLKMGFGNSGVLVLMFLLLFDLYYNLIEWVDLFQLFREIVG